MRITRFLFFATIFCVTFEKVRWNVAGNVSLADILALGFLILWTLERLAKHDRRLARTSAVVACFGLAFALAYFLGPVLQRWSAVGEAESGPRVLASLDGVELVATRLPVEDVLVTKRPRSGEQLVLRRRT